MHHHLDRPGGLGALFLHRYSCDGLESASSGAIRATVGESGAENRRIRPHRSDDWAHKREKGWGWANAVESSLMLAAPARKVSS